MNYLSPAFLFRLIAFLVAAGGSVLAQSNAAPLRSEPVGASGSSTEIVYLSGRGSDDAVEWDFLCSEGRRSGEWSKIRVPSCWELEGFGNYQYGIRYYKKPNPPGIAREQGTYRRNFDVPEQWRGKRIHLVFEGVMTDAHVQINGVHNNMLHQGGFYRFRYDVTHIVKYGAANELVVTVSKESANESVNLAERRADYWNFGGIFRPVFLEVAPMLNIERSAIDAHADGTFRMDVFLSGAARPGDQLRARVVDGEGRQIGDAFSAEAAPGGDKFTLSSKLASVKRWSAETPHLYSVEMELVNGGAVIHRAKERFGFRTFEVRPGQGFFLNGQRILLKGVNRHSFWPDSGRTLSRERNYADARLIKELNMNAVRMSHYPPDPEFLDACDELGLYVLNELGGWHGAYDTVVGQVLVGEMVRRDVNHPSILFWDNGNEGGWNTELDGEFAKWDPQGRLVLHPQKKHSGIETMHYRSYGEVQEYLRGEDIYMPTEFLHGLYDGGHGAGLHDYWEMMRRHPRSGGGFLWVLADEGIKRTDQGGRIDTMGNYGADGIVGPYHEREGSFQAVREIWSPVRILNTELPGDFSGQLSLENHYDFTVLDQCTFKWSLVRFPEISGGASETLASAEIKGPAVAPKSAGQLALNLPRDWKRGDVLYVTARDPNGRELWTWSWPVPRSDRAETPSSLRVPLDVQEKDAHWTLSCGDVVLTFSKKTGYLESVTRDGKKLSLGNGPRFVAARRGDRSLDGTFNPETAKGIERVYQEVSVASNPLAMNGEVRDGRATFSVDYHGALTRVVWSGSADGTLRVDYEYGYDGVVDLMGVAFDYPETAMKSIRWLGRGPYRVWQNRTQGGLLNVWENNYNDPIPGESWVYPEFKGYFRDWRWARFSTAEGTVSIENAGAAPYLGVYAPRDGRDALLFTLPNTGLAALDVIPAVRNKVNASDLTGPSAKPAAVSGPRKGSLVFRFPAE